MTFVRWRSAAGDRFFGQRLCLLFRAFPAVLFHTWGIHSTLGRLCIFRGGRFRSYSFGSGEESAPACGLAPIPSFEVFGDGEDPAMFPPSPECEAVGWALEVSGFAEEPVIDSHG